MNAHADQGEYTEPDEGMTKEEIIDTNAHKPTHEGMSKEEIINTNARKSRLPYDAVRVMFV